jgi:hypothetical protein
MAKLKGGLFPISGEMDGKVLVRSPHNHLLFFI